MRILGPKLEEHLQYQPAWNKSCLACHKGFKAGDYTTLIAIGPGNNRHSQMKCRLGEPYNAVSIEVHYACVTGFEPGEKFRYIL